MRIATLTFSIFLFTLACIAALLWSVDRQTKRAPVALPLLAVAPLVSVVLTALSLVPLPHSVRSLLNSASTQRTD